MAKRPRGKPRLNPLFNTLALALVALSCVCLCGTLVVFAKPDIIPAALRGPTTVPVVVISPTATAPTLTPTPTSTSTPTPTLTPTATPSPTFTPTETKATATPTPSDTTLTPPPTITPSEYQYTLQTGSPAYLPNYVNTAECNWMGIVGQAFRLDGRAELNLYVHLEGGGLNVDGVTGSQPSIGPGAYLIPMGNHPIVTTDTYRIQLRNTSGQALSDTYLIPTKSDCAKNLILVNFEQNH